MKAAYLLIGLYLLAIVYQGNESQLVTMLSSDKGFILWIVAIFLFWAVWQAAGTSQPIVTAFGALVVTALLINMATNPNTMNQFSELYQSLKG